MQLYIAPDFNEQQKSLHICVKKKSKKWIEKKKKTYDKMTGSIYYHLYSYYLKQLSLQSKLSKKNY